MKGILFKPDMIQAIIEGRKTQTRRVIKPQPLNDVRMISACDVWSWEFNGEFIGESKPRYQVGETVYIKETHCRSCHDDGLRNDAGEDFVCYQSDLGSQWKGEVPCIEGKWTSPMMMPEWAARYFITITDVRAERVQEITPQECLAEGIQELASHWLFAYQELWNSINKDYPWESNPWVFAYSFKKAEQ